MCIYKVANVYPLLPYSFFNSSTTISMLCEQGHTLPSFDENFHFAFKQTTQIEFLLLVLSLQCFLFHSLTHSLCVFWAFFSVILLFGRYALSSNTNRHFEQNSCRSLYLTCTFGCSIAINSSCVNRMHGKPRLQLQQQLG